MSHRGAYSAFDDGTRVAAQSKSVEANRPNERQPRELTGEQRLEAELKRIEQERKLIISYLPKNYVRDASPIADTMQMPRV